MLRFTYEVTKVSKKKDCIQYSLKAENDDPSFEMSEDDFYIKLPKIKLRVYGTPTEDNKLELGQKVHLSLTRVQ